MKAVKWLDAHIEEVLMVVLLIAMTLLMIIQVVLRQLFSSALSWAEEITRYFFIWSVFLSASMTLRKDTYIKLDAVLAVLSKRPAAKNAVILFSSIVMLVFFVFMLYTAIALFVNSAQRSATLNVSVRWIYGAVVLGFGMTAVRLIQIVIKKIRVFSGAEAGGGKHVG